MTSIYRPFRTSPARRVRRATRNENVRPAGSQIVAATPAPNVTTDAATASTTWGDESYQLLFAQANNPSLRLDTSASRAGVVTQRNRESSRQAQVASDKEARRPPHPSQPTNPKTAAGLYDAEDIFAEMLSPELIALMDEIIRRREMLVKANTRQIGGLPACFAFHDVWDYNCTLSPGLAASALPCCSLLSTDTAEERLRPQKRRVDDEDEDVLPSKKSKVANDDEGIAASPQGSDNAATGEDVEDGETAAPDHAEDNAQLGDVKVGGDSYDEKLAEAEGQEVKDDEKDDEDSQADGEPKGGEDDGKDDGEDVKKDDEDEDVKDDGEDVKGDDKDDEADEKDDGGEENADFDNEDEDHADD